MIKFNLKKISIYLLIYEIVLVILFSFIYLQQQRLKDSSFIITYLLTLGQIIGGLSIYLYQYKSFYKNKKIEYFGLELIYNRVNIKPKDKPLKIILLIFFASIFDFLNIIIDYHFSIEINGKVSKFFQFRDGVLKTIVSSLLYAYSLNFTFGKHHKFSLIFMITILIINIILEIIFKTSNILIKPFLFELFSKICRTVIISFTDCIDKYLYEANYMNPFKLLIYEGIFKLIFFTIFNVSKNNFKIKELKKFFKESSSGKICGIIFLLLGNLLISSIVKIFQIYCVAIHSPVIKSFAGYILAPLLNIFFFYDKNFFYYNVTFFVISEILSIIIDFFGCVYNEFIILFCCGLEYDTRHDISSRAISSINFPHSALLGDIQTEENNSEDRNTENT